jgi:flagellar protein FliO/FliZ
MIKFSNSKSFAHIICLICVFSFLQFNAFAQTAPKSDSASKTDSSTTALTAQSTDETAIQLDQTAPAAGTGTKPATTSSVWILVRIILALALVCFAIYAIVHFLKKSTGINIGNDPYLKSVATLSLSPNKSIQVITLGQKGYLVGITDQSINMIAEVTDAELVDAMNLQADKKNPVPTGSFQSLLGNFFPAMKKEATSGEGNSSPAATGFLQAQRERLRRGGDGDTGSDTGSMQ